MIIYLNMLQLLHKIALHIYLQEVVYFWSRNISLKLIAIQQLDQNLNYGYKKHIVYEDHSLAKQNRHRDCYPHCEWILVKRRTFISGTNTKIHDWFDQNMFILLRISTFRQIIRLSRTLVFGFVIMKLVNFFAMATML